MRDQEAEPKERTAKATIKLDAAGPKRFELDVKLERTQIWGIDFVGTVTVDHPTGESCTVYLPGVLSFDPAGTWHRRFRKYCQRDGCEVPQFASALCASVPLMRANFTAAFCDGLPRSLAPGITGDSHSSERIGPSCARMQTGITMAQL